MKKIKLLCRTRGLDFGATLEVGLEAGQISKEDALILINDSLAEEAKESIDGTNVNLIKENKALKEEIATLKAELEKAELEKAELEKAELEKAELEKAELEKAELEKAELEKAEAELNVKEAKSAEAKPAKK